MGVWTVADYVSKGRDIADAFDTQRWPTTQCIIDLSMVFQLEWENLLNASEGEQYSMQDVVVIVDQEGRFPISDLSTGSADTERRFYRIMAMQNYPVDSQLNTFYKKDTFKRWPNPQPAQGAWGNVWYQRGDDIQVIGSDVSAQLQVTVSWTPVPPDELASTASPVNFPQRDRLLLAYGLAAQMASKGGIEAAYAEGYFKQADILRQNMMDRIRRTSTDPAIMFGMDSPAEWGAGEI